LGIWKLFDRVMRGLVFRQCNSPKTYTVVKFSTLLASDAAAPKGKVFLSETNGCR
jgi:hypothetical protein